MVREQKTESELITELVAATKEAEQQVAAETPTYNQDARTALAEAGRMIEHLRRKLDEVTMSRCVHVNENRRLLSQWNSAEACEDRAKELRGNDQKNA